MFSLLIESLYLLLKKLNKTKTNLEELEIENIELKYLIKNLQQLISAKKIVYDDVLNRVIKKYNIDIHKLKKLETYQSKITKLETELFDLKNIILEKHQLQNELKQLKQLKQSGELIKSDSGYKKLQNENKELLNSINRMQNIIDGLNTKLQEYNSQNIDKKINDLKNKVNDLQKEQLDLHNIKRELVDTKEALIECNKKKDIIRNFSGKDRGDIQAWINKLKNILNKIDDKIEEEQKSLNPIFNIGQTNIYNFKLSNTMQNFEKEEKFLEIKKKNKTINSYTDFINDAKKNINLIVENLKILKNELVNYHDNNYYQIVNDNITNLSSKLVNIDIIELKLLDYPTQINNFIKEACSEVSCVHINVNINLEEKLKLIGQIIEDKFFSDKKTTKLIQLKNYTKNYNIYKQLVTQVGSDFFNNLFDKIKEVITMIKLIKKYNYIYKQQEIIKIDKLIKENNYNKKTIIDHVNAYMKMLYNYAQYFDNKMKLINANDTMFSDKRKMLYVLFNMIINYSQLEVHNYTNYLGNINSKTTNIALSKFRIGYTNKNFFYPENNFIKESVDYYNINLAEDDNIDTTILNNKDELNKLINYYFIMPLKYSSVIYNKLKNNTIDLIAFGILLQKYGLDLFLNNMSEFREVNNLGNMTLVEKTTPEVKYPKFEEEVPELPPLTETNIPPAPPIVGKNIISGTTCYKTDNIDVNFIRNICQLRLDKFEIKDINEIYVKYFSIIENIIRNKTDLGYIKDLNKLFEALISFGILLNGKKIELLNNKFDAAKHNLPKPTGNIGTETIRLN